MSCWMSSASTSPSKRLSVKFYAKKFGRPSLLPGSQRGDFTGIGWYALFMGAWYCVIHGVMNNPIIPLWSVSVEEQFYLFAPWTVKYLSRRSLYGFCMALILLSSAWLYFLGKELAVPRRIWFNSFVQFECFAGGILLCLVLRGRLPRLTLWHRIALLAVSFTCLFCASYLLHPSFDYYGERTPGSWHLIFGYALAELGCVLVLIAFLRS